jgi:hypothetical protein
VKFTLQITCRDLGNVVMTSSSGLSYDQVAHATAWHLREETAILQIKGNYATGGTYSRIHARRSRSVL